MGDYTGYAYNFKVKKDAPEKVLEIFKLITSPHESIVDFSATNIRETTSLSDEDIENLSFTLYCNSAYFEGWDAATVAYELLHSFKDNHFINYASCKVDDVRFKAVGVFLNAILPYIDCVDGEVLVRSIFEEGHQEKVYYFDEKQNKVVVGDGYKYYFRYSALECPEHPRSFRSAPDEFVPPNTMTGIAKANETNKKSQYQNSHYGFY